MTCATGRTDIHLHSHASNTTDYYAANAFAIPESHSDPRLLHPQLKRRGMALVTLSDHNTIDGVLELLAAGFTDVFISAEMTTRFPEDGCHIHVIIANVTEAQFHEANRLRDNVYEMVAYLDAEIAREHEGAATNRLAYFMAHPLMSTQNRPYGREGALGLAHIEKALLLFNTFEAQNGARTRALNQLTLQMLTTLTPEIIERLACKHNLAPKGEAPWLKALVGGSDDHSGINPGRTWTEFEHGAQGPTANDLIDGIRRRRTRPGGAHGGPITLAHAMLKLLYDTNRKASVAGAGARESGVRLDGPLRGLLELVFEQNEPPFAERLRRQASGAVRHVVRSWTQPDHGAGQPFERILELEVIRLQADRAFRVAIHTASSTDDRIFLVISTLVNGVFARYLSNLRAERGRHLVGALKELVALISSNLLVSVPYLISFLHQASDSLISRDVRKAFGLVQAPKLALVTDTFFDINGVSLTIRRMIQEAVRRNIELQVITCLSPDEYRRHATDPEIARWIDSGRLKILTSVSNLDFPEYDDLQVRFPPLLELLKHLQTEGFTKVQVSTPGTVGLGGLIAAKILQIETAATYHTCFPEYVENYTRDISLEALAWKYMILFYHSVDEVVVPSRFVAKLLHKRGLRKRKTLILDRWVNLERFHPRNRTPGFWSRFGLEQEDTLVKFIYVGRLGVEKNLDVVAAAYRRLRAARNDVHLIFVGDGPYRRELESQLAGLPVTFTGFLEGQTLAQAVASADVKLFPSTTDTWGNAPLEAQASGLPVVVANVGGPPELMIDGVSGFKINGHDAAALHDAMVTLTDEPTRREMGRMARAFAEANRVDEPFTAILDSTAYRRILELAASAPPDDRLRLVHEQDATGEVDSDQDMGSSRLALFG